ncbi:MAG: class I SAM-dependent methyltransferase [Catenulispora sp.]|nr:class I SAM-dependent methyltransferase [Catenulispora sp.]
MNYDALISEALSTPFVGWDFGVFDGRYSENGSLSWSYPTLVRERLAGAGSLLDLGTGGGELLSTLGPLPSRTAATEGYPPNVPVARRRLEPLGVEVVEVGDDDRLPFPDASFDVIADRHESYDPAEVRRVLTPGGIFITQQVGGRDLEEINEALGAPPHVYRDWDLAAATAELTGFEVLWSAEERSTAKFRDVGALVLFLRVTPWHVPDFDVERYDAPLRRLHERMAGGEPLIASGHRFALVARPTA